MSCNKVAVRYADLMQRIGYLDVVVDAMVDSSQILDSADMVVIQAAITGMAVHKFK